MVQLDVTFPGLPCGWLSLDAMDVSGELELDVDHDITKRRLSSSGVPLDDGEKHEVNPEEEPLRFTVVRCFTLLCQQH